MRKLALLGAAVVFVSTGLAPRLAHSQTSAPPSLAEVALAQKLFDEAGALFKAGDVHAACERFASSESLDPRGGTLLDLAICHEREGRTASAWSEFNRARIVAVNERRTDRALFAATHIEALAPRLAFVKVVVAPEPPDAPPPSISLDGATLSAVALGNEIPLDPGRHEIVASAPARLPQRVEVNVAEGVHAVARVGPLRVDPAHVTAAPPPHATAAPATARGWSRRETGYVVGAAALVALGAGSVFGVLAIDDRHDARNECTTSPCSAAAQSLSDAGLRNAWIADVGIGAGIAAVALGVILVVTGAPVEPSAKDADARTSAPTGLVPVWRF